MERELTDAQEAILLRTGCGQRRCGRKVLCVYTGEEIRRILGRKKETLLRAVWDYREWQF